LSGPIGPAALVRIALARNTALRATEQRARATQMQADAEGRWRPPEAEVFVQRIPVSKPYDVPGSQMIMLGLRQPIPAPGSLSAARALRQAERSEISASVEVLARQLAREVEHAFVAYWEARAREKILQRNKEESDRIAAFAQARYVAGGPLTDATQAEIDSALVGASIAEAQANAAAARSTLNGLLRRPVEAPLGEPEEPGIDSVADSTDIILRRALTLRPEVKVAVGRQETMLAAARDAEQQATWPEMSVGIFYYPPTRDMSGHGWGASFASTLPWAWGRAAESLRASRAMASSGRDDIDDVGARIGVEIATFAGALRAAEQRYVALRDRAHPAGLRAVAAASAGYESGRTDILMLLSARRALVDIESEMLAARAQMTHALVDLDWAAGERVRRRPLQAPPGDP
jgi:cobalt-zinc-cadmium efflux system outer membrane protein